MITGKFIGYLLLGILTLGVFFDVGFLVGLTWVAAVIATLAITCTTAYASSDEVLQDFVARSALDTKNKTSTTYFIVSVLIHYIPISMAALFNGHTWLGMLLLAFTFLATNLVFVLKGKLPQYFK